MDHKPSSSKETHKRNYDVTTPDEIPRKRRSSGVEATNSVEVQHHSKEKMPEPVQNKTETRNEVKDSRIFIKKDKKIIKNIDNSVDKKQSIIQKQTPVSNKKQIDSKKVTLKNGKALPPKQAIKKKQRRSPSPRFIVTLDGTRTSTTASSKIFMRCCFLGNIWKAVITTCLVQFFKFICVFCPFIKHSILKIVYGIKSMLPF
uniref:Uncharacterized protein n=1 Tax=Ciona savignyi TaxID=51511 RepID=H2YXV2_CIOSA